MMSSTSNKKSNFFFANCLQCEGIIRIPITIRPDSAVSCPHCSAQFDLIAYLDQIPEVSVSQASSQESVSTSDSDEFDIDTGEGIEKQDGKYIVPPQIAAGMRKRRGRRRRRSSSESANGSTSAGISSSSSSSSTASGSHLSEAEQLEKDRREERARREREKLQRQREAAALREKVQGEGGRRSGRSRSSRPSTPARNPAMELAKIIIGGLLAAPIAYLLLMWVFSRDPLGLVPTLYQYTPFLVPSKLILDEGEEENFVPSVEAKNDPTDILSDTEFDDFENEGEYQNADIYESEIKIP